MADASTGSLLLERDGKWLERDRHVDPWHGPHLVPRHAGQRRPLQCRSGGVLHLRPTSGETCPCLTFDASAFNDPEEASSALQVRWDWDSNGFCHTGWTTTKTTVRLLGTPGLQTVRLKVQVQDTKG